MELNPYLASRALPQNNIAQLISGANQSMAQMNTNGMGAINSLRDVGRANENELYSKKLSELQGSQAYINASPIQRQQMAQQASVGLELDKQNMIGQEQLFKQLGQEQQDASAMERLGVQEKGSMDRLGITETGQNTRQGNQIASTEREGESNRKNSTSNLMAQLRSAENQGSLNRASSESINNASIAGKANNIASQIESTERLKQNDIDVEEKKKELENNATTNLLEKYYKSPEEDKPLIKSKLEQLGFKGSLKSKQEKLADIGVEKVKANTQIIPQTAEQINDIINKGNFLFNDELSPALRDYYSGAVSDLLRTTEGQALMAKGPEAVYGAVKEQMKRTGLSTDTEFNFNPFNKEGFGFTRNLKEKTK